MPGVVGGTMSGSVPVGVSTFATGVTSINGGRSDEFITTVDGAPSIRVRAAGGFMMGAQNFDTVEEVQFGSCIAITSGRPPTGSIRRCRKCRRTPTTRGASGEPRRQCERAAPVPRLQHDHALRHDRPVEIQRATGADRAPRLAARLQRVVHLPTHDRQWRRRNDLLPNAFDDTGDPNAVRVEWDDAINRATWFDKSAFAAPRAGTFATAFEKNFLRNPGFWELNMSLRKSFATSRGQHLDARLEAFNVLNHTRLGNAVSNPTLADFGFITSCTGNRTMQVGIQYVF